MTVLAMVLESGSGLEPEMRSGSVQSRFYCLTVLTMGSGPGSCLESYSGLAMVAQGSGSV